MCSNYRPVTRLDRLYHQFEQLLIDLFKLDNVINVNARAEDAAHDSAHRAA